MRESIWEKGVSSSLTTGKGVLGETEENGVETVCGYHCCFLQDYGKSRQKGRKVGREFTRHKG